jgi:hypothetical protein
MKSTIFIFVVVFAVLVNALFNDSLDYNFMVGKTIGNWEGQVMTSAFPYNDEYAISVMMDGDVVILTNQFKDMFDIPKTHVKFWGTIESLKPLVIHVDGIGY